ncbi:MAG: polyamine ABC transporter substrate-binding protein [Neomegalonema sp.]|nr:polyamine ABC transporter substrate-binding protein [Neomegalonema sp.]
MVIRTLIGAATALAVCAGLAQADEDKVVNVYNWSDYIDEEILADFEAETGIKVVYDVFDSNEVLEAKLLAGGSGYDVVVPTGSFLSRQIKAGAFQKFDSAKLTNTGNLWDVVQKRTALYDPEHAYSINYMWGTTGIGYNVDKVTEILGADATIASLDTVFNPEKMAKLTECGVYFLDAPDEMIPAALKYLGEDPNSDDPAVVAKAEDVLMAVRPYVTKFHSSEYINALANGDICVAFGWSGDILQARDRAAEADNGVSVEYGIPVEGALMWFDMMAIPVDAPHPNNAHVFLDYIMRPEVMAKASNYVYYANGNKASQAFLNEDVIGDSAIYPDAATLDNLYVKEAYSPKTQRVATRLWTKVTTGQ